MPPRRALALIRNLPLESNTVAQMRGGSDFVGWGLDRYLMSTLIDAVQTNTHAFVMANSKNKPKAPPPINRPDDRKKHDDDGRSFKSIANKHLQAVKERRANQ